MTRRQHGGAPARVSMRPIPTDADVLEMLDRLRSSLPPHHDHALVRRAPTAMPTEADALTMLARLRRRSGPRLGKALARLVPRAPKMIPTERDVLRMLDRLGPGHSARRPLAHLGSRGVPTRKDVLSMLHRLTPSRLPSPARSVAHQATGHASPPRAQSLATPRQRSGAAR